jgi:hemerythrin superfamily protein
MRRNTPATLRGIIMDAFELLKNDHKKVSQLFKEIESASGQAKTQLFSRLKRELDVHAHVEETIFYPALEDTDEAREITLEAYEEHKVVKDLLAELARGGSPNDEWDAKLTVLKENVEHHVEEEEGELFSKARSVLSRDQIERFGAQMEAEKIRKQGGTAPRSQSTSQPVKAESPGVLERIASLVGLGDSSSGSKKNRKASGTKKSAGRKTSSKAKSRKQATKSATKKRAGATKKRTRSSSKAKGTRKASTSKTGRRQASSSARTSARKTAPRTAGTKMGKGRAGTKRSRAK